MSATVKVEIRQLPHGEGLALPAYQSADAAGLDLLAAVPVDTPLILPPGNYALRLSFREPGTGRTTLSETDIALEN